MNPTLGGIRRVRDNRVTNNPRQSPSESVESPRVSRLGVVGDIHGQPALLERALNALHRAHVDAIACVGDIVGPPEATDDTCALLMERSVFAVRGNHDRWFIEDMRHDQSLAKVISSASTEFLASLPPYLLFDMAVGGVMVCHGFGANDLGAVPQRFSRSFIRRARRLLAVPAECTVVISGHSHVRRVQLCEGILLASVGNLDSNASGGCAMFDAFSNSVSFLNY